MRLWLVVVARGAFGKAENAEVIFVAGTVGASDSDLDDNNPVSYLDSCRMKWEAGAGVANWPVQRLPEEEKLTVEVISAEHTSQTYLTPPSPPLAAVFLRMTPMSSRAAVGWAVPAPGSASGEDFGGFGAATRSWGVVQDRSRLLDDVETIILMIGLPWLACLMDGDGASSRDGPSGDGEFCASRARRLVIMPSWSISAGVEPTRPEVGVSVSSV